MQVSGWDVIYRVVFADNENLNDEFSMQEEAIKYAEDNIDYKPTVYGVEVYIDENGITTDNAEPVKLFSWDSKVEEPVEPDVDVDELEARLAALEDAEINDDAGGVLHRDFPMFDAVETPEKAEVLAEVAAPELVDKVKVKDLEEEIIFFNPLDQDFDVDVDDEDEKISAAIDNSLDPVEFLNDLAKQLGIEDEVEIKPVEDKIPDVEEAEVVADDSAFSEIPEVSERDFTPTMEFDSDFFSDCLEEPIATNAPQADEPCDPHCNIEEPAKKISKCHACPECGKEICECDKQKLDEAKDLSKVPGEVAYVLDQHRKELEDMCDGFSEKTPQDVKNYIINIIGKEANDTAAKKRIISEFKYGNNHRTKEEILTHVFNVILGASKLYTDPNKKWRKESLSESADAEIDSIVSEWANANTGLEEDTHNKYAKPAGDKIASFNNALKYAKKDNVPYIYGYTNKVEGNKFFALEQPIKCVGNDCEKKFRDKYKVCNVVYVAYPDKSFVDESKNSDLANKELFVEDKEMSDEEFAEAFRKGLEEKHCKEKKLVEAEDSSNIDFKVTDAVITLYKEDKYLGIDFDNYEVDVGEDYGEGEGFDSTETINGYTESDVGDDASELQDTMMWITSNKVDLRKEIGLDPNKGSVDADKFINATKNIPNFLEDLARAWAYVIGLHQAHSRIEDRERSKGGYSDNEDDYVESLKALKEKYSSKYKFITRKEWKDFNAGKIDTIEGPSDEEYQYKITRQGDKILVEIINYRDTAYAINSEYWNAREETCEPREYSKVVNSLDEANNFLVSCYDK